MFRLLYGLHQRTASWKKPAIVCETGNGETRRVLSTQEISVIFDLNFRHFAAQVEGA